MRKTRRLVRTYDAGTLNKGSTGDDSGLRHIRTSSTPRSIPNMFNIPHYDALIEPRKQHERLNLRSLSWPPEGFDSV